MDILDNFRNPEMVAKREARAKAGLEISTKEKHKINLQIIESITKNFYGLYLEFSRNPDQFHSAIQAALRRDVPEAEVEVNREDAAWCFKDKGTGLVYVTIETNNILNNAKPMREFWGDVSLNHPVSKTIRPAVITKGDTDLEKDVWLLVQEGELYQKDFKK